MKRVRFPPLPLPQSVKTVFFAFCKKRIAISLVTLSSIGKTAYTLSSGGAGHFGGKTYFHILSCETGGWLHLGRQLTEHRIPCIPFPSTTGCFHSVFWILLQILFLAKVLILKVEVFLSLSRVKSTFWISLA